MPRTHRVEQGDCIASIAKLHGFFPQTLWDDPANAKLKAKRDPYVLLPGDEVVIPDLRQAFVRCSTGAVHRFRRKGVPQQYRVRLLKDGRPQANVPFLLSVDGNRYEGNTDAEGMLEVWIPPKARQGILEIESELYALHFGHLDPAETRQGFLARLCNLGRLSQEELEDPVACERAIIEFKQTHCGLEDFVDLEDEESRTQASRINESAVEAILREHGS